MPAVLDTSVSLVPPGPGLDLDVGALLAYLQCHAPSALCSPHGAPGNTAALLDIRQFSHGQSNPTYRVANAPHGPAVLTKPLVLRKKPPGPILPSAHSVEREYTVLAALAAGSAVPVPRPLALCEDVAVLGTPFYLMEYAQGTIFVDPNLPGLTAGARASIYGQMCRALAALHSTDVAAVGLTGFGSADHYSARQLRRWSGQYAASVASPPPDVQRLLGWLRAHVPAADAAAGARPCICHGDFRLDNLVFDGQGSAGDFRLTAVLDWELSTLGNRWADVAYNCLPYHLPPGLAVLPRLASGPQGQVPEGIPTETEYVAMYCQAAGVTPPSPADWAFYIGLSLFRLVAILAGVQARAKQGNASSGMAAAVSSDEVLASLVAAALAAVQAPPIAGPLPTAKVAPPLGLPDHVQQLLARVRGFVDEHVIPAEEVLEAHAAGPDRWTIHPLVEGLKAQAKEAGLWNLWLPGPLADRLRHLVPLVDDPADARVLLGAGLSNWEYAHVCEAMGRSVWAPEAFNCAAPDTGNMEVLARYGSPAQQQTWLLPLLQGRIRSCFAMTEKAVASSDATNITARIRRVPGTEQYEVSGVKWWTSGACDPRCAVAIFMGKTDLSAPLHKQQSMVLVPFNAPGVRVVRPMLVFGYDDAPHGHAEVEFDRVLIPATNLIQGEGKGFDIAQGRLGPGRLHHCMRLIGLAERAMELSAARAASRTVFGRPLAAQGGYRVELAKCRVHLEAARLMVLHAAAALDALGNKAARGQLAAAKYLAPNVAQQVVDAAIQAHGAAGVSQDTVLARLWTGARTLRLADGPDEVHLGTIAKLELARSARL